MIIVDLDDTLFNTRPAFREARIAALKKLGVSEELYYATYQAARQLDGRDGFYSSRRHAEIFGLHGFKVDAILAALEDTTKPAQLKKFLFPDTVIFLEKLRALGEPLVLLSLGDEEFQYLKVHGAGLAKYFDRMFFVNDTKEHVVRELLSNVSDSVVWFVNDRVSDSVVLQKLWAPRLRVVLKQAGERPLEEYLGSGLPYFKTLTEIYDHIVSKK
jgi:phosphoglycolate phosphatase-like HAD superfamily hydrolase